MNYFKSIQSRTFFFSFCGSSEGFFFYLQKKVYYTRVRIAAARISQIELKERSHSLKCYHKKNLLLLHTCRVYRISHLLIRLRKGMFRYFFEKEFSPSGYIRSDAKFFKGILSDLPQRGKTPIVNSLCLTI